MLILVSPETGYPWPVEFRAPDPAVAGARVTVQFTARFRFVAQARIDEIWRRLREQGQQAAPSADDEMLLSDETLVREALIGWGDVCTPDGQPVPYSDTALDAVLAVPGARAAIARAWLNSLIEGERGN